MDKKIKWRKYPFPYLIIDNFLSNEDFIKLTNELDKTKTYVQSLFKSPLENKIIFKDTNMKKNVRKLVDRMGSSEIKNIISQIIDSKNILSMRDFDNYGGYSPYHITENNGFLGAHIDHSSMNGDEFSHIANTIFYASNKWEKEWGGHTILFSRNGFLQEVKIDPIPNRLIFFIHTANSFHGVSRYYSDLNVQRRTFYHDYYISKNEIGRVMNKINLNRKQNLIHSFHQTTFIPLIPFGIKNIKFNKLLILKNLKYFPTYLLYLLNRYTRSTHLDFKKVPFLKKFLFFINLINKK